MQLVLDALINLRSSNNLIIHCCHGSKNLKFKMAAMACIQLNCMCSSGAKKVAAVDSCFALVRARQHCIAKH